jgi:hypothetical protein
MAPRGSSWQPLSSLIYRFSNSNNKHFWHISPMKPSYSFSDSSTRCIVNYYVYMLPGPMYGSTRSLQTYERPPGSDERNRGLNSSLLGNRSRANFALFLNPNIRVWSYILGFTSGKWTPKKNGTVGTDILSKAAHMAFLMIPNSHWWAGGSLTKFLMSRYDYFNKLHLPKENPLCVLALVKRASATCTTSWTASSSKLISR